MYTNYSTLLVTNYYCKIPLNVVVNFILRNDLTIILIMPIRISGISMIRVLFMVIYGNQLLNSLSLHYYYCICTRLSLLSISFSQLCYQNQRVTSYATAKGFLVCHQPIRHFFLRHNSLLVPNGNAVIDAGDRINSNRQSIIGRIELQPHKLRNDRHSGAYMT